MGADPGPAAPALSSPPGAFLNKHEFRVLFVLKKLNMNSALPVCSPVTLGLISTRPWSSGACGTSVAARQSPLEGRWDDLGGQVEVIPQVLDTLVGQVPAMNFSLNHCILHMNLKTTFFCIFR